MYEGPIKAARHAGTDESPVLRQLRWSDLVARLAATRGQRPQLAEAADDQAASFAAFQLGADQNGQQPVNRDALSRGKFARLSISDPAATAMDGGDRET